MKLAFCMAIGLSLAAAPTRFENPGQDAKDDKKAPPTLAQMMPKPGPEMTKLASMVGVWKVEETVETSPMGPGGKGHGISRITAGPGGLSLLIDYRSTGGHMNGFRGHGVLAWDGETKSFKQSWTDNMVPTMMMATGRWEGDTLIITTEATMMGQPFKARDTFSGIGTDKFTLVSEMSLGGSPMAKVMTLVHTRQKEGPKK